jgi:DNA-binding transcriptional ArsR family regulator
VIFLIKLVRINDEDNFISTPEIGCNVQLLYNGLTLPFSSLLSGHIKQLLTSLYEKIHSSSEGDPASPGASGGYIDPRFKRVLWYLIGSTKGGANRAKILKALSERAANPNQLSTVLKLDYKTVLHHLKVLSENGLVITDDKDKYAAAYFLTPLMENNYESFRAILEKIKDI